MDSWVSTGLEDASNFLLAKLRARVPMEIEKGWSLYVADDSGDAGRHAGVASARTISRPVVRRAGVSGQEPRAACCSPSRAQHLPDEIWLRCVRENEKAWRWYEREGFVFEKEQVEPMTGFMMKYYRWKKEGNRT